MKRIGVDIDGVLNNFNAWLCEFLRNKYHLNPDEHTYQVLDKLNWTKKQIEDFWEIFFSIVISTSKPEQDAVEVLNYLKDFYEIHIITARDYNQAIRTEEWFNKYQIPYTQLHFNCGNKVNTCKWLNVSAMIEDSPYNLIALRENHINTIKFSRPYNKDIRMNFNANSWLDILDFLSIL